MELIDVYDENNNFLNYSADRDEIHKKKLWHRHVSAWVMNQEGKVLLQQRSFNKKKNPGKWAKTGGHVDAGETCDEAMKREVFEEIGIILDNDNFINFEVIKRHSPKENYYIYNYIIFTDLKEKDFTLDEEEVAKVKYYTIEEIEKTRRQNNENYVYYKWTDEEFNSQIRFLKEFRESLTKRKEKLHK